ncbi:hypothetical protein FZEAL_3628 [Fusarium zealandicum]|uniref:Uncharacterized protein n=1 Tax=Fusarium zealandicum TaxID=1053134 RepID=A0A8H4UNG3_9HYPO|nr:hypothetical protein FZEAL_3628 [Fusarium zealandicum]
MAPNAMPSPQLQRRGSVDQLFELVEGLNESQIHSLLEDFNNTVTSNIPVSHGIDLFEHPTKSPPVRASSIRKSFKLPRLLTRSPSKRTSSAPTISSRPRTALPSAKKHYRRISRPVLSSPTSGPDLNVLLSAYLATAPPQPKASSPSRSISSSSTMTFESDDTGIDLLAPLVFGRPQREQGRIGDIMEVLQF